MMKNYVGAAVLALGFAVIGQAASAGPIASACMASNRQAASPALCGCIQQVADITLGNADQRRVASFFRDPDKAQTVRMSKTRADDAFWDRYQVFGQQAQMACSG